MFFGVLVYIVFSLMPASAQRVRSVAQLRRVVDTLMARHDYHAAVRIADSVLKIKKMAVPEAYGCAARAYMAMGQYELSNGNNDVINRLLTRSNDCAILSGDRELIYDNFNTILSFRLSSVNYSFSLLFCNKALEYASGEDSLNQSLRASAYSTMGHMYQTLGENVMAVDNYKKSLEYYRACGDCNNAMSQCYSIIRRSIVAGADSVEMGWANNLLDMFHDTLVSRGQCHVRAQRNYYLGKARYYEYVGRYHEAIACWDSMVHYYDMELTEKELTNPGFNKAKYINMSAYSYAYRISFLEKLGRNDVIEQYARFADDSTDIVLDDLACLQYLLGEHYARVNDYDRAYRYYRQSYFNYQKAYGDSSYVTYKSAYFWLRYALSTRRVSDGIEAAPIAERLLGNVSNNFENINALDLYQQLAALSLLRNDKDGLQEYLIKTERTFSSMLLKNFGFMSEQSFSDFWKRIDVECSSVLQMSKDIGDMSPELARSVYRIVLTQKNLYFVSQSHLKRIARSSSENMDIYRNVSIARKLVSETGSRLDPRIYDSLSTLARRGEDMLLSSDTMQLHVKKLLSADFDLVRARLAEGSVVVEFSEVFKYPPEILYSCPDTCVYPYVAVAFDSHSGQPELINLFTRYQLENYTLADGSTLGQALARRTPSDIDNIYSDAGLARMIWGPILERFPNARSIFFSPTGLLHSIAVENLPLADGSPMSDRYRMSRIFSSAFYEGDHEQRQLEDIALFGGISYDSPDSGSLLADNTRDNGNSYQYLPSTYEECDYIRARASNSIDARFHYGHDASEDAIKSYSGHSPSILHIATHGYFNPSDSSANLLNMSGLVFAGANRWSRSCPPPESADNGLLVASEIAELDFSDTRLAVLSACETGLGCVNSDGLFGLMRGFKLAGVSSVMTSLWSVADDATSLFMRRFYAHMLSGHTAHEALEYARGFLRQGNRYSHPYYWAGFVLVE